MWIITCGCTAYARAMLSVNAIKLIASLCVIVHTATASSGLPSDCTVVGWTVPKPPDGAKLLQVQVIIRSANEPIIYVFEDGATTLVLFS